MASGSLLQRNRYQLLGALVFAVAVPFLLRLALGIDPSDADIVHKSLAAAALAVLLGHFVFQSVTRYPGIQRSYFVLPVFSVAFGAMLVAMFGLRIDYNRLTLAMSFAGCIAWYYGVTILARRRTLKVAVVPFGRVEKLYAVDGVNWQPLAAPRLDLIEGCDALVADLRFDLPDEWERFISDAALAGAIVLHVKQLRESLTGQVTIDHLSENQFGSIIPVSAYLRTKYGIDFVLAAVAAVVLSPLLIGIAVAIRLTSPGPALFRQTRIGYAGKPFSVFKFRTMYVDDGRSASRTGAMTEDNDPRVTRIGRFLRKSRLDELPQILNILSGEMSWIGPRPEARVLSEWYESELPFYRYRHIVRPGITGWAQINQGHVAEVEDVLSKLHYDFYYIRNLSMWLDAFICVRTVVIMLTGFGAR